MAFTLLALPGVLAATSNIDATLNTDASNTREGASLLPGFGTYQGTFVNDDVDWYRVNASSSSPQCVDLSFSGVSGKVMLEHESDGVTRAVHTRTKDLAGKAAVAAPRGGLTYLGGAHLATGTATYTMATTAQGLPSASTGDALTGGDAGSSAPASLAVKPGCVGGRLSGSSDVRDVYAIHIPTGEQLVYTFAAGGATPLRASVLDTAGQVVASITSGGFATFSPPSGGTYYVAVSADAMEYPDVPYLVGLTVGPPDPGSSCRPYC